MSECVIINKAIKVCLLNFQVSLADIEEQYQDLVRSGNNMVCQVKSLILEVYQAKKQQQVRLVSENILEVHSFFTNNVRSYVYVYAA